VRYFAFGSMRDPRVLEVVLGRPVSPKMPKAHLHGWKARVLAGKPYPALVRARHGLVPGVLVRVDEADWRRIEHYEADEYEWAEVEVYREPHGQRITVRAYTEVAPELVRDIQPRMAWDFGAFQLQVPGYLPSVRDWMAELT